MTQTISSSDQLAPTEAAHPSADEGFFIKPWPMALCYMAIAALIGLGAGVGQGMVTANIAQIAGDLGATTAQASWLLVAYMLPRAALPILLIKIRTQYGLRRFTQWSIMLYVLAEFAAIMSEDLRSALFVDVLSGAASACFSTLAFLYMIEPLGAKARAVVGLPMALCFLIMGPSLARVMSPYLIEDGGLLRIHLAAFGTAAVSLAAVIFLPLTQVPHMKVLKPLDFFSFFLVATGFGALITTFVFGPIYWWNDAAWLGVLMVVGVIALTSFVIVELRRKEPLIDVRWIMSPEILHLTAALLFFRIILSEQSAGAPRMFQVMGIAPSQMMNLFGIICVFTVLGAMLCAVVMRPNRIPLMHLTALMLIAVGAWMDSQSSPLTHPRQMYVSQAAIAVAGMLFMPPAMLIGLTHALKKGPQYILSFIIIFISTQSVGGMIGSGIFNGLLNYRQAFHYAVLIEQLDPTHPVVAATINAQATVIASTDPILRQAEGIAQLAGSTSVQAYILAYNDMYFITFLLAIFAAACLCLHLGRNALAAWLTTRNTPSSRETQS